MHGNTYHTHNGDVGKKCDDLCKHRYEIFGKGYGEHIVRHKSHFQPPEALGVGNAVPDWSMFDYGRNFADAK